MMDMELTKEETAAINSLKRLAKRWPKSLWLWSASGTLCVMRSSESGEHVVTANQGVDPSYTVAEISGIDNDGGDW